MPSRHALWLALLFPMTLSAQRPDTTMVPRALAIALIDFMGERNPQIIAGRVPEERLSALVPRGARVLGGVIYGNQPNSRTTTILVMPDTPDSALVLVGATLESAGFKPAPTFEMMGGGRGGFVATSIGGMRGNTLNYCSENESVTASITEGESRGSVVRLMSSGSLRNTICDPTRLERMRRVDVEEIELPTLRPPTGATGGSTGSSGSGDSRSTYATLRSSLGAAEMVDHFAPQLRQQGWTLANRATDGDLSALTARRTNAKGESLYLQLSDHRYGPRDHNLTLRVWMQPRLP